MLQVSFIKMLKFVKLVHYLEILDFQVEKKVRTLTIIFQLVLLIESSLQKYTNTYT